jgi:Phage integrase, N-terminal SAM-like domain
MRRVRPGSRRLAMPRPIRKPLACGYPAAPVTSDISTLRAEEGHAGRTTAIREQRYTDSCPLLRLLPVLEDRWQLEVTRRGLTPLSLLLPGTAGDRDDLDDLDDWLNREDIPDGVPFLISPDLGYDVDLNRYFLRPALVGSSRNTQLAAARDVRRFLDFLWCSRGRRGWRDAAEADHDAYWYWRRQDPAGPRVAGATWNRELSMLNGFYGWAARHGLVLTSPIAQRQRRPAPRDRGHGGLAGTVPAPLLPRHPDPLARRRAAPRLHHQRHLRDRRRSRPVHPVSQQSAPRPSAAHEVPAYRSPGHPDPGAGSRVPAGRCQELRAAASMPPAACAAARMPLGIAVSRQSPRPVLIAARGHLADGSRARSCRSACQERRPSDWLLPSIKITMTPSWIAM